MYIWLMRFVPTNVQDELLPLRALQGCLGHRWFANAVNVFNVSSVQSIASCFGACQQNVFHNHRVPHVRMSQYLYV